MIKRAKELIFFALLAIMLTPTKGWPASETPSNLSHGNDQDITHLIENQEDRPAKKVKLVIRVIVPHNKEAVDQFDLYPYPFEPAKIRVAIGRLPSEPSSLNDCLNALGYTARIALDDPYPAWGWRMQYAFKTAVRKSQLAFPHGLVELAGWRQAMRPYLLEEVLKSNAYEKQRRERYVAAVKEFKESRTEIEIEALRQGLYPIYVYVRKGRGITREGYAMVDQATWWVVGTHRVAGLTYHWQERVKLTDADEQVVNLNEDNALFIEGGW